MNHGSLFSGIGGFDLAAQWMGWENIFQVEIDGFCQQVLQKNFPNAERYRDIKEFNGDRYRGTIDVLSGGFPCQPYSTAGKRKGKEDDRHLWPEMLRIIREISPRWVVGENVRGLVSWNGGMVFDEVQADLEAAGYEVLPFLLPAAGVGAPHRRDRIWFVAHALRSGTRSENRTACDEGRSAGEDWSAGIRQAYGPAGTGGAIASCSDGITPNSEIGGRRLCPPSDIGPTTGEKHTPGNEAEVCLQQFPANTNNERLEGVRVNTTVSRENAGNIVRSAWDTWPTQSPVCGRNDGVPNRLDRIKALGNAVVPAIVFQIFKAIQEYENICQENSQEQD